MDSYLVVTVTEATKLLRVSKPTLYRYLQKDPTFPKPIHLTEKKVVFRVEALKDWLVKKEGVPFVKEKYLNALSPLYEYVTKVCDKRSLIDIPVDKVFATEWELEKYTIDGAYKRFKEWARGEGYFPRGDYPIKKKFCSAVTEIYKDVEVKRGSLWLDNGVTKERTQRNIFALKK